MVQRILIVSFLFISRVLSSQVNPNPCDPPYDLCQDGGHNGIVFSSGDTLDYCAPGRTMPFWAAFGDTVSGKIDTSFHSEFIISLLEGPGELTGSSGTPMLPYVYFNTIGFTLPGIYKVGFLGGNGSGYRRVLHFNVPPAINICTDIPGLTCGDVRGNQIVARPQTLNVLPVDPVLPIAVGVIDSISGKLDSSYYGTIYVEQVSGPGMVYGTLSMTGINWFNFRDLRFTQPGHYVIGFYEENRLGYQPAFLEFDVIETTSVVELERVPLKTFPNPFKDIINTEVPGAVSLGSEVVVMDTFLNTVYRKIIQGSSEVISLQLNSLPNGFYFLMIKDLHAGKIYYSGIIKD